MPRMRSFARILSTSLPSVTRSPDELMPRRTRVILPGVPLHITQRGVDRCPTFLVDEDFAFYRWALGQAVPKAGCTVHAYVLMTNHLHLLVTPAEQDGPARMMREVGLRYVRYFNDRYRRTGTLWEGRYRSALVDSAPYFFACSRYIEANPVRAGIVSDPREYEWSSVRHNADGRNDPLVGEHSLYLALGRDRAARSAAYRAMSATPLALGAVATIRAAQKARAKMFRTSYQQAVDATAGSRALPQSRR
jgi:putative transposase